MINQLLEFFYCFIYACSMMICVNKYINRKINKIELIFLLILYGFVDYVITGNIILNIHYDFIIDILVIVSDFLMVCIFQRKFSIYILFYTTIFYTIYSAIVVIVTYSLSYIPNFNIFMTYNPSYLRFFLVIQFAFLTILVFKILNKKNVIPIQDIVKDKYKIFCLMDFVAVFALTIFQWFNTMYEVNQYSYMILIIFVFLWLTLLYTLNRSFVLAQQKENEMIVNSIHQNVEQYMRQYQNDEKEIRKIKHDIKNHFTIIKNLESKQYVDEYVDSIFLDLENLNVLSKTLSGNMYVDAIMNSKQLEYPDVKMNYIFSILNLHMSSIDLGAILFNLLDNACLAANKVKGYVDVEMIYDDIHLIIEIRNSCFSKTNFISKRGSGHGYGINIVKGIVKKYHGDIEFKSLESEVIVKVGLTV